MRRRQSGISVPLFAIASSNSWGIGEFADLPMFARWLQEAGQSIVQILPINEMPPIETSPYSAMTAMALDPIYITMANVPDFAGIGAEFALDGAEQAELKRLRESTKIEYGSIRRLKEKWLRRGFDRFLKLEVSRGSPRAARFDAFVAAENWWLGEYTLFRSLHVMHGERAWSEWPEPLKRAETAAVYEARQSLELEIRYRSYVQWLAADQWAEAKRLSWPVRVFGDLPFMNSADSPDVWARQHEFRFDSTIGVPPDAFSKTGQDWGLPPWRHDVMAKSGFMWMRSRARRYGDLYDGFRIDHLVGLYRTYVRPIDKSQENFFEPADEAAQIELGEKLIGILAGAHTLPAFAEATAGKPEVIAEDLGSIPPFVRESMARLDLPGLKVLRWERHWDREDHPAIDPAEFPERSVATTGTHDIEPLAATAEGDTEEKRSAVLQSLLAAGSYLTLIPLQDVFGWANRINTPAVVDDVNWTWRVKWPVDRWLNPEEPMDRADQLMAWTRAAGR